MGETINRFEHIVGEAIDRTRIKTLATCIGVSGFIADMNRQKSSKFLDFAEPFKFPAHSKHLLGGMALGYVLRLSSEGLKELSSATRNLISFGATMAVSAAMETSIGDFVLNRPSTHDPLDIAWTTTAGLAGLLCVKPKVDENPSKIAE